MNTTTIKRIVLFASGNGSNAKAIINYFRNNSHVVVAHLFCNKADAGVLHIAMQEGIPYTLLTDKRAFQQAQWLAELQALQPDLIVLAGFLWQIPPAVVAAFPKHIINIHPALLPAYGGKGMYGHKVHEAVLAHGERESGITIHWVNEHYDEGTIILQASCAVEKNDTAKTLAERIHQLEHKHYPIVIEKLLEGVG